MRHIETECISRYSHFTCTFCTYRSTYKANMSRHIRNVHKTTNKLRYRCDRCNFASNYRFCVRRHMKSFHRYTGDDVIIEEYH